MQNFIPRQSQMDVRLQKVPGGRTYERPAEEPLNVFNKSFVKAENQYSQREDANDERMKVANESSNTISVKVPNAYNIVSATTSAPLTSNTKKEALTKENTPEKKLEIGEIKEYTDGPKAAGNTLGFQQSETLGGPTEVR